MSRQIPREELATVSRIFRRTGIPIREIAERLDVSESSVKRALYPNRVAWEADYKRRQQRQGTCVDCGKTISSNSSAPAKRCMACYHARRRLLRTKDTEA